MEVIYCGHSGFAVHAERRLLIFDYLGAGLLPPDPAHSAVAFISHSHSDHCWQGMSDWAREGRVCLFVGDDVRIGAGVAMKSGDCMQTEDGVRIQAYGSTDAGVSFRVCVDNMSIFHAGDFNFWHWRAESTADEVREAESAFERVLDTLSGKPVDLAFFPVDPRMGPGYEEGALRFAEALRPRVLIPMHFWDQPEAALSFGRRAMPEGVAVQVLTRPGEQIHLDI